MCKPVRFGICDDYKIALPDLGEVQFYLSPQGIHTGEGELTFAGEIEFMYLPCWWSVILTCLDLT